MTDDNDTIPTLDGPASLTFRQPSTPPELPSFAEPTERHRTAFYCPTDDGPPVVSVPYAAEPQDAPAEPDDAEQDPGDESAPVTLTARACGYCGRDITKRRKGCLYCDGACRVAAHRDPARGDVVAKAERRERKGTPALFAKEAGR